MAHPQQFDTDDPVLAKVRAICLGFPGAAEKISHGRPNFFTKKIFCGYGAVLKGDHHSGRYDQSIIIMPDESETEAFDQDDRFFVPGYWGPYGWRGFDLRGTVDWAEVTELIDASYRNTAPKKLIAELDGA